MEEWKDVGDNYEYEVSNTGRVRRKGSSIDKASRDRKGYPVVNLYRDGNGSTKSIHRLVAQAFVPNPDNKPDVNHKDGDKHNNSVDNLEWVTKSENMKHAYQTGLAKPHASYGMLGKKNPNAGRKGKPVRLIETGDEFDSIKDCAIAIDGDDRRICDCLSGKQRMYKGYHFEYI